MFSLEYSEKSRDTFKCQLLRGFVVFLDSALSLITEYWVWKQAIVHLGV